MGNKNNLYNSKQISEKVKNSTPVHWIGSSHLVIFSDDYLSYEVYQEVKKNLYKLVEIGEVVKPVPDFLSDLDKFYYQEDES